MNQASINFQGVSFTYDTMTSLLLEELTVHFPIGWTGIIGANGVGKTTILRLATGDLEPQQGRVSGPENRIYCQQRTDDTPDMLLELIEATDGDAHEIKGRLEVDDDWSSRWVTLSHGERKRAQIAVAMWRRPHVLAVDEPTKFFLYEVYRDEAAFKAHQQTEHYLTWRQTVADWMAQPRQGVKHSSIFPTSEDQAWRGSF